MRATALLLVLVALAPGCLQAPWGGGNPAPPAEVQREAIRIDTEVGVITALVFRDAAPKTVAFMERLARSDYYVGREFTRVIPGFVIQQVDRTGGTTDTRERVPLEAPEGGPMFAAGAFGIARDADPDSGGPEFFVMDFATSRLYRNYTVWAQTVDGMDVVHAIARVQSVRTGPASSPPAPVPLPAPPEEAPYVALHDQVALAPVKIRKVSFVQLSMPAEVAARHPPQVGDTVSANGTRATLEWPADVAVGKRSALAWYVFTSPDAPMPDMAGYRVSVEEGNATTPLDATSDRADPRILRVEWTFRGPATFVLANETFTARTRVVPAG